VSSATYVWYITMPRTILSVPLRHIKTGKKNLCVKENLCHPPILSLFHIYVCTNKHVALVCKKGRKLPHIHPYIVFSHCYAFAFSHSLSLTLTLFLLFKRRKKRNWMKYTCYIIFTLSDRGWRHFLMFSFFAIYMWESDNFPGLSIHFNPFFSHPHHTRH
jgi:hypothetical protein